MLKQTYNIGKLLTDANVKNEHIPLQVNCCGVTVSEGPNVQNRMRNDFYYMYILHGKIEYENDVISAGDVILFEEGKTINYRKNGDLTYLWVHFTGYEAKTAALSTFGKLNRKIHIGFHDDIQNTFEKLFREFIIRDKHFESMSVCLLREILSLTERYSNESSVPLKSIEYLHEHYDEDIPIEKLASMEEMCITTYRKAFKKHTGVSPNEYLINLRINAACRMLSQTNEKISTISQKVGYSDPYYFSRIFTKKLNISPREYRKK